MANEPNMFNETWTWNEHKVFEKVFSQFSDAPDLIDRVCVAVGTKTYEEVKKHCEEAVEDLRLFEESEIKIENKKLDLGHRDANRAGESSGENQGNQKRQRRQ